MKDRRQWISILKVQGTYNYQPRILYLAKIPCEIKDEIKTFIDKQNLREFVTSRLALKETLKTILRLKEK